MLDIQGHRGCRGILPENTLPAFRKAIELGVTTLEMDLAITSDSVVIVSHEPFFNHEISTHPERIEVTPENQLSFNIYAMTYEEVRKWDVGLKPHPRFPDQEKIAVEKPSLDEVFTMSEKLTAALGKDPMLYNIEIKSRPQSDNIFHPTVEVFVDLVIKVVKDHQLEDRVTIQSFDLRALQYLHQAYPYMESAYLIANDNTVEVNIDSLGFIPDIYSPDYNLVDSNLVAYCHSHHMRLIPWTVNTNEEIERMIHIGVDGIISDYPDRVIEIIKKSNQQ